MSEGGFLRDWGRLVAIAVAAVVLWFGLTSPSVGEVEAALLAAALPLVAIGLAAGRAFDRPVPRRWPVVAVLLAGLVVGELAVWRELSPPAPYGSVRLERADDAGTIAVPAGARRLRVVVAGEIEGTGVSRYVVSFARGEARDVVLGEVSRQVRGDRSFGGTVPTERLEIDQVREDEIELDGAGPVQVSRDDAEASLEVTLSPPRRERLPAWLLAALVVIAVLVQAQLAARGQRAPLAPAIAAVAIFAAAMPSFDLDAPLRFVAGVALLAGLGGGLGGWVVGGIASAVARARAARRGGDPGAQA